MKKSLNILTILFVTLLISCGGKEEKKKEGFSYEKKTTTEKTTTKAEIQTIEEVKKIMEEGYDDIHLILASQNSVAFRFGQAYDRRNLPQITIYQYEKDRKTPYPWGVSISNSPNTDPSIKQIEFTDHIKQTV